MYVDLLTNAVHSKHSLCIICYLYSSLIHGFIVLSYDTHCSMPIQDLTIKFFQRMRENQ